MDSSEARDWMLILHKNCERKKKPNDRRSTQTRNPYSAHTRHNKIQRTITMILPSPEIFICCCCRIENCEEDRIIIHSDPKSQRPVYEQRRRLTLILRSKLERSVCFQIISSHQPVSGHRSIHSHTAVLEQAQRSSEQKAGQASNETQDHEASHTAMQMHTELNWMKKEKNWTKKKKTDTKTKRNWFVVRFVYSLSLLSYFIAGRSSKKRKDELDFSVTWKLNTPCRTRPVGK